MPITDHLDQTFGVEIECFLPEGGSQQDVSNAIHQRTNRAAGPQSYNHRVSTGWKITTDGSLDDYTRGIEVVSPILRGAAGIAEVESVIRTLTDFGCTVSRRCGFHVHVGCAAGAVAPPPLDFLKAIVNLYAAYEPVIDSIMPPSRRLSANNFIRSIANASPAAVNGATNFDDLVRIVTGMAPHDDNGRYRKLNLHAYRRHKTIEFRQHSGTLEPTKIKRWIGLCLRMTATAHNRPTINAAPVIPATTTLLNRARIGSKTWQIGQMMLRPEGVTGPEACERVGWPSVSMPAQARLCGLTVTQVREGRNVRYFARAAAAAVAAQPVATAPVITLDGFADFIGADADERAYLRQRQTDLGGAISWAA